jgi:hypothetical protein
MSGAAEDIDPLTQVIVTLPYDRTKTLAELVNGWLKHVKRLQAEEHCSLQDPRVWGAHDYIAALHLRDMVFTGVDQFPSEIRDIAVSRVTTADEAFKSFTEPDLRGVVDRFSGEQHVDSEWWWKRLSKSGPAREQLQQIAD